MLPRPVGVRRGHVVTFVFAAALSSAPIAAADFWDDKHFSAWSSTQVAKMLTASPWARRLTILTPDFSLARRVGGLTGGVVGNGGRGARASGGGVAGDGVGNLGGGSFLASPDRTPIVVRWISALPVRQALVRERQANGDIASPPPPHLDAVDPFYRIAVVGLPFTQEMGSRDDLQSVTWLKRTDKVRAPIQAMSVSFEYERELLTIVYAFSKAEPIRENDDEIEFVTKLAQTEVKTRFKLKEMTVGGQLVL